MSARVLPVLHEAGSAFSYECRACNRCCRGRGIQVAPYELIRLACNRGVSTTEFRRRWMDSGGVFLAQQRDGRCVFLGEHGCTVHADRPLVCRLYPLGRIVRATGEEVFVQLEPAAGSAGVYGESGLVADYLATQDVAPYLQAEQRYRELLKAMQERCTASQVEGRDRPLNEAGGTSEPSAAAWVLDPDPVIAAWCLEQGLPEPPDVESRSQRHLEALSAWVQGTWTPPEPDPAA